MHTAWIIGLTAVLLASPVAVGAQVFWGSGSLDESPCELRLEIGRTSTGAATLYKLQRANALPSATAPFGMSSLQQYECGYSSPYLAAALPVPLGDTAVLRLSGSCTIPSTSEAYYNTSSTRRTWSADTLWATLEAVLAVPVYGGFNAVAGFRWDNWQTGYTNPRDATSSWYADTDTSAVTVNSYLPFLGIVSSFDGLSVGAIGLPFYFGAFEKDVSFNQSAQRRARFFRTHG